MPLPFADKVRLLPRVPVNAYVHSSDRRRPRPSHATYYQIAPFDLGIRLRLRDQAAYPLQCDRLNFHLPIALPLVNIRVCLIMSFFEEHDVALLRVLTELIMAMGDYIDRHNDNPKPFIWTAKASDILEKVKRARRALNIVRSV
jgi:hypothetical protein